MSLRSYTVWTGDTDDLNTYFNLNIISLFIQSVETVFIKMSGNYIQCLKLYCTMWECIPLCTGVLLL